MEIAHERATFMSPRRRVMSNSLSSRIAVSIDRSSRTASRPGAMPRKSLVAGGPHWARPDAVNGAHPGSSVLSNMSPSAEVLDQEPVGIAPVVEDLAALDVPADPPRPVIPQLAQVFTARRNRVQIACLIGGVHIAVRRAQRQRQRVVVGGRRSAVAADEAHRRAAVALARVVHEVADDQPEVVEVPVQCLRCTSCSAARHDPTSAPGRARAAGAGWRWCGAARARS